MRCPRLDELPAPPPGKLGWPWTEETGPPTDSGSDSDSWPRITVVTPSYNQAMFLEETIRSVLLQAYPNLEYVVMDGGSTDGSREIIRKYEKHLAYWTSAKDAGASDAIKKGFERATGSLFAYLNSDDVYLPDALHQIEAGFRQKAADIVYGNMYWMDREGKIVGERRQTPFSRIGYLYGGADLMQPATFWTAEIYRKAGGMDPSFQFAFDMDLFARFMASGAKFAHIRQFVASFRMHSAQKSDVINESGRRETNLIRERHARFPVQSVFGRLLRSFARIQRMMWYLRQGDLLWLIGRIPDRVKSHTSAARPVGPRSKWM
jgi:glycosyltransferase involved in cell wall biosynthesis